MILLPDWLPSTSIVSTFGRHCVYDMILQMADEEMDLSKRLGSYYLLCSDGALGYRLLLPLDGDESIDAKYERRRGENSYEESHETS